MFHVTEESCLSFENLKRRDILSIPTTVLAASFWKDGNAAASEFADSMFSQHFLNEVNKMLLL